MLADYAKDKNRRVAVASNRRILEFVQKTALEVGAGPVHDETGAARMSTPGEQAEYRSPSWLGREYAVETVRSITATEQSDRYLMSCPLLLETLALVARGGPFVSQSQAPLSEASAASGRGSSGPAPLASPKARQHACIALMNLSCGKANKLEIARVPSVLESMRDVMAQPLGPDAPPLALETRMKATTCVKNLSNADQNDGALLGTPGLVEALGRVAEATCSPKRGATACTTNACLAIMNLSISKPNKHRVFLAEGVMDALIAVIDRTSPLDSSGEPRKWSKKEAKDNGEARIKSCSALSNLAIGYDNKVPMFGYPGFVEAILRVIETDRDEARTKACSILWSFAAEMKNQVPVVQRGDILPALVRVAEEGDSTEAQFKCVAALTLLAESLENAVPLLQAGALAPLMHILHTAGSDPTQWQGQTASWCVGFLMNIAQSDDAVVSLREAGVVELLAPLLSLDHYQSLKAAMAITFVCRFDEDDEAYDLLRRTENVIPKIISLLHNTLSGHGGNGYKYGVFTLRSSVGCISSLASGPDFMKERIATGPVFESLLRVLTDFCVDGGNPGAIVGGGQDDAISATLAVRALQSLTAHLIPVTGSSALPFGPVMDESLLRALRSFESSPHPELHNDTRLLATDAKVRIQGSQKRSRSIPLSGSAPSSPLAHATHIADDISVGVASVAASIAQSCCGLDAFPGAGENFFQNITQPMLAQQQQQHLMPVASLGEVSGSSSGQDDHDMEVVDANEVAPSPAPPATPEDKAVRTFLLADSRTGRRFAVPSDPSGGRLFNDNRVWCFRRGRFCLPGEDPDPNFVWTEELQAAYVAAVARQSARTASTASSNGSISSTSSRSLGGTSVSIGPTGH